MEPFFICQYFNKSNNNHLKEQYDILSASQLKKLFIDLFFDALNNNKLEINLKYNKFYLLNLEKIDPKTGKYELIEKNYIDVIIYFYHFYDKLNYFLST